MRPLRWVSGTGTFRWSAASCWDTADGRDEQRLGDRGDAAPVAELAQDRQLPYVHEANATRSVDQLVLVLHRARSRDGGACDSQPRSSVTTDAVLLGVALVWGSSYLVAKDLDRRRAGRRGPRAAVRDLRGRARPRLPARPGDGSPERGRWASASCSGCTQAAVLTLETYGVSAHHGDQRRPDHQPDRRPHPAARRRVEAPAAARALLRRHGRRRGGRRPARVGRRLPRAGVGRRADARRRGRPRRAREPRRAAHRRPPVRLPDAHRDPGRGRRRGPVGRRAHLGSASAVPTLPPTAWAQLAYLALACTVFAFLAQTWAIRRTSPSRASLLMGTEPVWAVAVGVGIGGEHLTVATAVGAVARSSLPPTTASTSNAPTAWPRPPIQLPVGSGVSAGVPTGAMPPAGGCCQTDRDEGIRRCSLNPPAPLSRADEP